MKICFMSYFPMLPYRGGVQRVTTVLGKEFERRGYDVCFLCYDFEAKDKADESSILFPQHYINIKSKGKKEIGRLIRDFISEHKIDWLISQEQDYESEKIIEALNNEVHVISVHHTVPFAAHNTTRKKIMRDISSHSFRMFIIKTVALICPFCFIRHRINKEKRIFEVVARYSDRLVFISERFLDRVSLYLPDCPKSKLTAINNPNSFDVGSAVDYESKENIVLWVGRMDANKNCMDFVKAWGTFSKTHMDWNAVVVGDGPMMAICKKWVEKHSVRNITFKGYQKNVVDLYRKAKIFVSTSYSESWGMSLTEAMSMGCVPCVYNTYEALADIITDGVDGVLCDPRPNKLAIIINDLAKNEDKMAEMATRAQVSVARFSVSKICDQWEELLNEKTIIGND